MTKIFIILFGLFLFIAIFLGENRFFVKQCFENNTALEYYFSENYPQAEKSLSGALKEKQDEIILFNLANTFLKQALENKNLEEKITGLEKSIEIYTQALEVKNKDFIENNLEIATKLLEKYKQNEKSGENNQKNNQEDNQNNSQENSDKNNGEKSQDSYQESEEEDNKDDGGSQNKQNQTGENGESTKQFNQLSNDQTQEIENYLEELKQIEKNNQQFFNKQQNQDDFFEKFSNDPFLQNEFNRGGEKDW